MSKNLYSHMMYILKIHILKVYGQTYINILLTHVVLCLSISLLSFQDMTRTGIHYAKWLRRDNSINIHGSIMVLWFCHSPHCCLAINRRDLIEHPRQHWFYFQPILPILTLSVTINFFPKISICILFPYGKQPFVIFSDFCIFYFD